MADKQTATEVKLDLILSELKDIKICLFGKEGLRIKVDRLERSRLNRNAVMCVILTTILGVAGTVIASILKG